MISSFEPPSSSSSSSDEDSDDEYREEDGNSERSNSKVCIEEVEEVEKEEIASRKRKRGKTKDEFHPCPFCEKKFRYPNKLREHIKIHDSNRYQCLECSTITKFGTYGELRAHHKLHHSKASHKCPQCSYTNEKPAFIRRHFEQNHVDGIPCTITGCCIKVAKNRLKAHIKEYHTSIPLSTEQTRSKLSFNKCPLCEYKPDVSDDDPEQQQKDLEDHVQRIHEEREPALCTLGCGVYLGSGSVSEHLSTCSSLIQNIPSSSQSTPALQNDEWNDANTETTLSTITGTSSQFERDSVSEVTNDLSENINDIDEEIEFGTTEPPNKIRKHSRSRVHGDFSCEICLKTFTLRDNLRKHVRVYHSENSQKVVKSTGPKHQEQYKCDRKSKDGDETTCGKTFRTEQALHDHFNVHDGIKPYSCHTCNQKFHARDRFAVHLSKYHQTSIKDLTARVATFGC
ncbi:Putative zinc finger protein F56D1.1 [Caenorhabditis elegans]|nr:Putative zinc finger protein F56D1.1 [Caenorhabditis elegans]CCD68954.2 Putative zinc finger protein F56D1.1 [Caenorhabditis elegans]|eukprot:NP_495042.3 Putative zinc finger protein F56D1.1 [Caenorhabditis elegans]